MMDLSKGFCLGPWEIRPQQGRLRSNQTEKHLEPKQMTLLLLLAQHFGEVVSKDMVLAHVWPDTHVSSSGLTRNMSQLRKALGDQSREPQFIATIPKRGYQLIVEPRSLPVPYEALPDRDVAPVDPQNGAAGILNVTTESGHIKPNVSVNEKQNWQKKRFYLPLVFLLGMVVTAAFFNLRDRGSFDPEEVGEPFETLAVLPFVNRSQQPETQFFADGLTEELIDILGSLEGFKVVARTSSFAFRNKTMDVREIGEVLQVGKILEGSVTREPDLLRVSVRLIDTRSGFQVWSQTYERQVEDVFEVQKDIARSVGQKMSPALKHEWSEWQSRTQDVAAYDQYLMGQFWCRTGDMRKYPDAIKCFEKAVAVDPQFARAYASMARAWTLLGQSGLAAGRDWMAQAQRAAEQAIALDDRQDEAYGALGMVAMFRDQDWKAAEQALEKAVTINPQNPLIHIWYAQILRSSGRFEAAVAQTELSIKCDPLNPFVYFYAVPAFLSAGQLNQAEASLKKVLKVFPKFEAAHLLTAQLASYRQNWQEALQTCQTLDPNEGRLMGRLAEIYANLGAVARAQNLHGKIIEARDQGKPFSPFEIAVIQAALNRHEEAITWLELAAKDRDPRFILEFASHPGLDPLRNNPRMARLTSDVGLPVTKSESVLN